MAQSDNKMDEKGSNAIFVMERYEINNIPADQNFTYGRLAVDYKEQTGNPNGVRLTAAEGGNMIKYQGKTICVC